MFRAIAEERTEPKLRTIFGRHPGIFWHVRKAAHGPPLSESEPYQVHHMHPHSHIELWERSRLVGKVLGESEYEEFRRTGWTTRTPDYSYSTGRCPMS
jgi:hypothetical protein